MRENNINFASKQLTLCYIYPKNFRFACALYNYSFALPTLKKFYLKIN